MRDFNQKEMGRMDVSCPSQPADRSLLNEPVHDLQVTWLGHATFLVQINGFNILTDPVFSDRASPVRFAGPRRVTPLPLHPSELPPIDVVLLSHTHYDHLDISSIGWLQFLSRKSLENSARVVGMSGGGSVERRFAGTQYISPLRSLRPVVNSGVLQSEVAHDVMDWWDVASVDAPARTVTPLHRVRPPRADGMGRVSETAPVQWARDALLQVACVPAQHNTARGITDYNTSLWSGFAVKSGERSVYFTGDTGFASSHGRGEGDAAWEEDPTVPVPVPVCPAFEQIGQTLGPFDVGLLPIGAYSPRWFMSAVHTNPSDAVRIHQLTRCRRSIGMHWGTFRLTDEPLMEPTEKLQHAAQKAGLQPGEFTAEAVGSTVSVGERA
jgi:N-acyl-phosphatidylethanolamine-hydrolysing phospholipase D